MSNPLLEIGFVLLTSDTRLINVVSESPPNIPHVSLFQAVIEENKTGFLLEELTVLCNTYLPLVLKQEGPLKNFQGNLVLKLLPEGKNNKKRFLKLKKEVIALVKPFISQEKRLAQIQKEKLTPTEKALVLKYGIYWGVTKKAFLKPHMTLAYKSTNLSSLASLKTLDSLRFDSLGVGILGHHGNVHTLLKTIEAKNT